MSYLLETLGRGLLAELLCAFEGQLPGLADDDPEELERRQARSPTSVDLALRLGASYLRRRQLSEAKKAFEAALALSQPLTSLNPEPRTLLGRTADTEVGRYVRTADETTAATDRTADTEVGRYQRKGCGPAGRRPLPAALGLACVYDELGRLDETLRHLTLAQAHDPTDPAIAFALGFCYERDGNRDAAVASYRQALKLCPQLRNAHERLAAIALAGGDYAEATRCYERLAELEPGDLDVLLALANLYLQTDRPREASNQYQQALTIDPDFADEPLPEAENLSDPSQIAEAVATLEHLVARYPSAAAFHVHLGDLYVRTGDELGAIEQYRAALQTQPDLLEATVKLGTQHLRMGRYVDAAQTFNRAVEINDRLMLAFVGLGVSQHVAGNEKEACATLDLAASLEPSSTLLFAEAARLHLKTERLKMQEPEIGNARCAGDGLIEEALPDGPDEVDLLREVIRRHAEALQSNPNHADLHYRHGLLLRQVGEYEEAIRAFRKAVAINPAYVKALVKLGICLKETGQTEEAIEVFRQALVLDDRFVDVHYQLGLLFVQRSRFELAVEEFERAVAGNGRNLAFRANLALALQSAGMLDRAAATWRSICELSTPRDHVLERRVHILRKMNRE